MLDVRLQPGSSVDIPVPAGHTGMVYVFRGEAVSGGAALREGLAGFITTPRRDGSLTITTRPDAALVSVPAAHAKASASPADAAKGIAAFEPAAVAAIVILGEPIDEPIARRGPFVMNTRREIEQAFEDYRCRRPCATLRVACVTLGVLHLRRSGKIQRESRVRGEL
jgi:redox-sensitive bicupin YhaK (pirin superfamily)